MAERDVLSTFLDLVENIGTAGRIHFTGAGAEANQFWAGLSLLRGQVAEAETLAQIRERRAALIEQGKRRAVGIQRRAAALKLAKAEAGQADTEAEALAGAVRVVCGQCPNGGPGCRQEVTCTVRRLTLEVARLAFKAAETDRAATEAAQTAFKQANRIDRLAERTEHGAGGRAETVRRLAADRYAATWGPAARDRVTGLSHTEHVKRAGVATPCTADVMTFGGRCLNCGFNPEA
jgi:hypothetical protein